MKAVAQAFCEECDEPIESYEFTPFYVISADMYYGIAVPGTERHVRVKGGEPEYKVEPCGHRVYTVIVHGSEGDSK